MTPCWIAFGGNLGDVPRTFDAVCDTLRTAGLTVAQRSRVYETAPMGAHAGGRFCNAAAELHTSLPPLELLHVLQAVETAHGRRRELRWGPRTIDLDLILYGDETIQTPRLTVPHPACWYRRFVLDPLVDIAPQVMHPVFRFTLAELRERLLPRPLPLALTPNFPAEEVIRDQLSQTFGANIRWVADAGEAVIAFAPIDAAAASDDPADRPRIAPLVLLGQGSDAVQAATDVLSAALDEPRPLN